MHRIERDGTPIPVVAFYSVQGGVGKSTLARKFAELVTRASGEQGRHPNVLLVDLDVEAMGLTYRLLNGVIPNSGSIHEAIATRNPNIAHAHNVTANVSLVSSGTAQRGQLYLLPGAPPEETNLFTVIEGISCDELIQVVTDTVNQIVSMHGISCVVFDCEPGAKKYSAAAATLATTPLLIGRNEDSTYQQIQVLPLRFQKFYSTFQPAKQAVVINAVAVSDFYEERAKRYAVADWIPLTSDVIHETEGVQKIESLRMLLFENYVIDLIKKFLIGHDELIPNGHDVLPEEWLDMLKKLPRLSAAPRMKMLRFTARCLFTLGCLLGLAALCILIAIQVGMIGTDGASDLNFGAIAGVGVGMFLIASAVFPMRERSRLERLAEELRVGGPEEVFRRIRLERSQRRQLNEMLSIVKKIPTESPLR